MKTLTLLLIVLLFTKRYWPSIRVLKKENFYTKEPVKILRLSLGKKTWFYHLTFRRFL
jgi:hypothetical protein